MRCRILKGSNNTLNLIWFALVFKPHDLRPEIYIKRLGTTTQNFNSDRLLNTGIREVHIF